MTLFDQSSTLEPDKKNSGPDKMAVVSIVQLLLARLEVSTNTLTVTGDFLVNIDSPQCGRVEDVGVEL